MKVGIAGLGSSGSFLLNLLSKDGFDVTGFDPKKDGYYIPCGYAANYSRMKELIALCGLNFDDYVLSMAEKVTFRNSKNKSITFRSKGLCTFDKNSLERDLISQTNWERRKLTGKFDLIVDATGISRSYLPLTEDFTMKAIEYVSDLREKHDFEFNYFDHGSGYSWIFPIKGKYHVGAGSDSSEKISSALSGYSRERIVSRNIRLKPLFDHSAHQNTIGIGESIGTVSPITGEGIVPSMKSALLLFKAVKASEDLAEIKRLYQESLIKEFGYYNRLYDLLIKFRRGEIKISSNLIRYAIDARKDLRGFGIDFRVTRILRNFL